ncbi:MAG: hypothetical protein MUF62_03525, partial [Chitinophagaceae bacterium]|nr:hypothetical protein [Chitinophagaceae bacterium]
MLVQKAGANSNSRRILIGFFLCSILTKANTQDFTQQLPRPFNISIESRWGIQREQLRIQDPGGMLATAADPQAFWGLGLSAPTGNPHLRLGLNIDHSFVGRDISFSGYTQQSGQTFWRFNPFAEYSIPLTNRKGKDRFYFTVQAGPSFSTTMGRQPGPKAIDNFNAQLLTGGDTMYAKMNNSSLLRSELFGLSGAIGVGWQANHRLSFLLTVGGHVRLGNDVSVQTLNYRHQQSPGNHWATVRSTGNMVATTLGIRYTVGATEKTLARRARIGRRGIDTAFLRTHRWEAELLTSSFYPSISLSDAGGHLARLRHQRFTYGARIRYRLAPRWFISAGFETHPYALEAKPDKDFFLGWSTIAANVNNAVQVPVMGEYLLWRTTKKLKLDVLAGAGLTLGIQRQALWPDMLEQVRLPGDVNSHPQNIYYEDIQLQEGPGKTYWAATGQLQAKWHVSRHIYLHGYLRYQHDLTNQPEFMRLWAAYRYGSPTAPEHKALLGQSP